LKREKGPKGNKWGSWRGGWEKSSRPRRLPIRELVGENPQDPRSERTTCDGVVTTPGKGGAHKGGMGGKKRHLLQWKVFCKGEGGTARFQRKEAMTPPKVQGPEGGEIIGHVKPDLRKRARLS